MTPIYLMSCLATLWISEVISQDPETSDLSNLPYHELSKETFNISNKNALFGYSIAYQKRINSLIVGSPLENDFGQVRVCAIPEVSNDLTKSKDCQRLKIDTTRFSKRAKTINHTWWFGANVNVGDSFLMACMPRYVYDHGKDLQTSGRCFYKETKDRESFNKDFNVNLQLMNYVNDDPQKKEYHKKIFDEYPPVSKPELLADTLGLSSHVSGSEIFTGGPVMSIGRVAVYHGVNNSPKLLLVDNNDLKKRNKKISFNFGYSITSGNFTSSDKFEVAVSTPYGTIGYGRIYFYEYDGGEYKAMEMWVDSTDLGSMFGACLASLRLGTRSALLVGAPAYASPGYDVGAVFVYTFEANAETFDVETIFIKTLQANKESGGRFGTSIVTIGDFDGDDIHEVAIAAPYENGGRGAVYIYSGKNLVTKSEIDKGDTVSSVPWIQKLLPEESPNAELFFGLALASPDDADQNGCNELAIGVPGDNSVTLLRCIASLSVSFNVQFPNMMDIAKALNFGDTSFLFRPCIMVQPFTKPDPKKIKSILNFKIEIIHPNVTMENSVDNTISYPLKIQPNLICIPDPLKVLLPQKADYDRDIKFKISLELTQNPLKETSFDPYLVLINKGTFYSEEFTAPPLPGSDLTFNIHTTFKDNYTIGSSESENLTISMWNAGNTAYGACVRTRIEGVTITRLPKECFQANGELRCIADMLTRGESWEVSLTLSTKHLTSSNEQIEITSELFTSSCSQPVPGQNKNITINLTRDVVIQINKFSTPHLKVNVTEQDFAKGKNIDHIYEITNKGMTLWTNVPCQVILPPQVKVEKVTVQTTPVKVCEVENHIAYCSIAQLSNNIPINIKVQMKILPDSPFINQIKKGKATVDTELTLHFLETRLEKITTLLTLWEALEVPLWMIVVAVLFAILMVVVLFWFLHECGCLERTNKQELEKLKTEVKRQSMRKSIMLRQSTIEVVPNKTDRERLISVTEEDAANDNDDFQNHLNEKPVKEVKIDDKDPARVAFNAELAKALAKGGESVVTKADIH